MNIEEQTLIAERQLDRILQFSSRVENKVNILFATNIGIIAVTLNNLNYSDVSVWYISIPLFVSLVLISQSIFFLYKATYPRLEGGASSLVYFSEIAKRTERNFQRDFREQSLEDLKSDLLGQVWRNSQILSQKFSFVQKAFSWTLASTIPWVIFLFTSSIMHGRVILVK